MHEFSTRQHRFIGFVVAGASAAEAARKAGYSERTARQQGARLLSNVGIAKEITRRQNAVVRRLEINAETATLETARIAFSDPRRLFRKDGSLKPVRELDDDTAAAVASIEVKRDKDGDLVTKVKLWSKPEALRNLAVMLGLIKPFQRRGEEDDRARGMEQRELRESLAALTPEQRANLREIAETMAARRKAVAEGSTLIEHEQHSDDQR